MTDDLTLWAQRHGVSAAALADLHATLGCFPAPAKLRLGAPRSESHIQSLVRLSEARDGCTLWRNNVGAGKLDNGSFVRWGLANESEQMNRQIKSSDLIGWRRVTITPQMVGRTIAQLAADESREAFDVYRDLLRADRLATTILQLVGHEENVQAIMRHPAHTGGSDGLLVGARPHPRAWGTFPRFLGHYSRELGVLGLAECVAHLTGNAARRLRLRDRGLIRAGYAADIVLFDPETVRDTATFEQPRQQPAGIEHVFVNGVSVLEDGRRTSAVPGRALRRTHGSETA